MRLLNITLQNLYYLTQKSEQFIPFFGEQSILVSLPIMVFLIGLFGVIFNRRNLIILLLSLELMLLAANLNFIFISIQQFTPHGQLFSLLILTVAAAESAIGLGIVIVLFRLQKNVSFEKFAQLRG